MNVNQGFNCVRMKKAANGKGVLTVVPDDQEPPLPMGDALDIDLLIIDEQYSIWKGVFILRQLYHDAQFKMVACDAEFHQYWNEMIDAGESRIAIAQFAIGTYCVIFDLEKMFKSGPQVIREPMDAIRWDLFRCQVWPLFEFLFDKTIVKVWFNSDADVQTIRKTAEIFELLELLPEPTYTCQWHSVHKPDSKSSRRMSREKRKHGLEQHPDTQTDYHGADGESDREAREIFSQDKPFPSIDDLISTINTIPTGETVQKQGCLCNCSNFDLQSVIRIGIGLGPRKLASLSAFNFAQLLTLYKDFDPAFGIIASFKNLIRWGGLKWTKPQGLWHEWTSDLNVVGYCVADAIGIAYLGKLFFMDGQNTPAVYQIYRGAYFNREKVKGGKRQAAIIATDKKRAEKAREEATARGDIIPLEAAQQPVTDSIFPSQAEGSRRKKRRPSKEAAVQRSGAKPASTFPRPRDKGGLTTLLPRGGYKAPKAGRREITVDWGAADGLDLLGDSSDAQSETHSEHTVLTEPSAASVEEQNLSVMEQLKRSKERIRAEHVGSVRQSAFRPSLGESLTSGRLEERTAHWERRGRGRGRGRGRDRGRGKGGHGRWHGGGSAAGDESESEGRGSSTAYSADASRNASTHSSAAPAALARPADPSTFGIGWDWSF